MGYRSSVAVETTESDGGGPYSGYAPPEKRPSLGSYALTTTALNAGFAAALIAARKSGRELPERIGPGDVLLIGTASHKLSRLITKEKVTAFVRAPFTELEGKGGPGEVEERPRGTGLRRTIGELLVCPFCLGLWASAGFHAGLVWAPRTTRLLASTLTGLTISDFLQIAYKAAEERGLGDG